MPPTKGHITKVIQVAGTSLIGVCGVPGRRTEIRHYRMVSTTDGEMYCVVVENHREIRKGSLLVIKELDHTFWQEIIDE